MKPPPPPRPPKPFPWFRTSLVLGGLTAGVIVFARYHPDLPWCRQVDQITRPAIEKTCDTGSQAWDWARGRWTNIGRSDPAAPTNPAQPGAEASNGPAANDPNLPALSVYFTPTQTGSRAAVSGVLCSMIRSAEHSVQASYADFDDADVAQALIAAHKTKGVSVQLGVDNRNCMQPAVQSLIRAGVPVATDRSGGPVRANFLIIDGQMVCYGSVVPTAKSLYHDNNCLFTIADRKLAARFQQFFLELYPAATADATTGTGTATAAGNDLNLPLVIDGLQAYTGDDAQTLNRVVELLNAATTSVTVLAPALGNDGINEALSKAGRRGVQVRVCLDRAAALSSEQQLLLQNDHVDVVYTAEAGTLGENMLVIDHRLAVQFGGAWRPVRFQFHRGIGLMMQSRGMAGVFEAEYDRLSRHGPPAPDGYAFELVRGHDIAPLVVAVRSETISARPAIAALPSAPSARPVVVTPAVAVAKPLATNPAAAQPAATGKPAPAPAPSSIAPATETGHAASTASKPHHTHHHHTSQKPK